MIHFTNKYLFELGASEDCVAFFERNKLIGMPESVFEAITGSNVHIEELHRARATTVLARDSQGRVVEQEVGGVVSEIKYQGCHIIEQRPSQVVLWHTNGKRLGTFATMPEIKFDDNGFIESVKGLYEQVCDDDGNVVYYKSKHKEYWQQFDDIGQLVKRWETVEAEFHSDGQLASRGGLRIPFFEKGESL